MVDDFYAASSAHDRQAIAALLTPDAVVWTNESTISGRNEIVDEIMTSPGLTAERTAPVTVDGDFATTYISFPVPAAGINEAPIVETVQLGDGKIFRLWDFALGVTPPFDDTATP